MPHEYSPLYSRETFRSAFISTKAPGLDCVNDIFPVTLCCDRWASKVMAWLARMNDNNGNNSHHCHHPTVVINVRELRGIVTLDY